VTSTIRRLIEEGARVFRINFSHGTLDDHALLVERVREAATETGIPVAVLGDLGGPKIRLGDLAEEGVELAAGREVVFRGRAPDPSAAGDRIELPVNDPRFIGEVAPGERVLLDDGRIHLRSTGTEETRDGTGLVCRVEVGGRVTSHKGINLPDSDLRFPVLTDWDRECARFAVHQRFDFLALSFVRGGHDVRSLKEHLATLGVDCDEDLDAPAADAEGRAARFMPIVSKIEKPQAVAGLESILAESHGVMVARGDLGVEMDLAEVAVTQKKIIRACQAHGIPVIVATQMLHSMIESPDPTRAEVSDVANAIFDGVDAVMLSGETAVGRWPVSAVRMMKRIASSAAEYLREQDVRAVLPFRPDSARLRRSALAHGVKTIVEDGNARLIVAWSVPGSGAIYLSRFRIPRPVIAFSSSPTHLRRLALLYGMQPMFLAAPASAEEFVRHADRILQEQGLAACGDPVVLVSQGRLGNGPPLETVSLHTVGECAPEGEGTGPDHPS
jgi:pyruvate kinase